MKTYKDILKTQKDLQDFYIENNLQSIEYYGRCSQMYI